MDEYIKIVLQIKQTLQGVTASGADNWERLLASCQALDRLAEKLREGAQE